MSAHDEVLQRLIKVARALGPLVDEVVLVGGCVPATYVLSELTVAQRATDDVDLLVDAKTRAEYYELTERWKSATGMAERPEDGVICRYELAGELVDLMPTSEDVLSFGNPW